jgi:hypothetical protein
LYATNPAISGDGRCVAYDIVSGNPQDPFSGRTETWLYVRQTAVVEPVSVRPDGTVGGSNEPTISDDGRYVAFTGEPGLDPTVPATPLYGGLYVRDMVENRTTFMARNVFGVPVQFPQVSNPALADDGRYIAVNRVSEHELSVGITIDDLAPTGHARSPSRTRAPVRDQRPATPASAPAVSPSRDFELDGEGVTRRGALVARPRCWSRRARRRPGRDRDSDLEQGGTPGGGRAGAGTAASVSHRTDPEPIGVPGRPVDDGDLAS